jgi:transcriptional regulator with XRE-family HTH domain
MVKTEGELLKMWVESKGYTAQQIADMLGLTARTSVYYVYKQAVLSVDYKEILSKAGFSVDDVRKVSNPKNGGESNTIRAYDQIIIALENKVNELMKDHYKLRGEVSMLKDLMKPIKK